MHASVGDRLVVHGRTIDTKDRSGEIVETRGPEGAPPFLVRYAELNAVIDRLAAQYGVPAEAIATAWILRHPARWQVVLGTTTPSRVTAAAAGSDVTLTRYEWYELYRAAGHILP